MMASAIVGLLALSVAAPLPAPAGGLSPLHPPVRFLDQDGRSVLQTGRPISTMTTCTTCHDTAAIAAHNYHSWVGLDERLANDAEAKGHKWDFSPGLFGRWNPLVYRCLSQPGDARLDLGVAEWIQTQGWRHVGGGPAWVGFGGKPLATVAASSQPGPDTHVLAADTRKPQAWNWQASGAAELNCFLCHVPHPDNDARVRELEEGRFQWAASATLANTGLVRPAGAGWAYRSEMFAADGSVDAVRLGLQSPTSRHCGQCHGQVHRGEEPVRLSYSIRDWSTATKGQVYSPQRVSDSAVNLTDKAQRTRPWDVHAERMLECGNCHFSLNHPASFESSPRSRPGHLKYEPRRLSLAEYLARPSHQLAKGHTSQGTIARHLDGTMRRCADCHDAAASHPWLPYQATHFRKLSCEACHIPQVDAPAIAQIDWTLLTPSGEPRVEWRGIEGNPADSRAIVSGFRPVLLPQEDLDGQTRLVPHNLITAVYWVEGGPQPRPVRLADLKAALLSGNGYRPTIAQAFHEKEDADDESGVPVIRTTEQMEIVRKHLIAAGVRDPRVEVEVQPYSIHHGVSPARWAIRQCDTCHSGPSRIGEPFVLTVRSTLGIAPKLVGDAGIAELGRLTTDYRNGVVCYPQWQRSEFYVLGHDHWRWVDVLGLIALLGVIAGVAGHTTARIWPSHKTKF